MFRSFIKYAGGKTKVLPYILPHFTDADIFVEPFVGSGVAFINTNYNKYILADINIDLINTYKIIKQDSLRFVIEGKKLFVKENNLKEQYLKFRNDFNKTKDVFYKSLLFVYLNRHCFNGLCRYNSLGKFNVPFGKYKSIYFPENEILCFGKKLQRAELLWADFDTVFKMIKGKDCVIYCDPPYNPLSNTSSFVEFAGNKFGKDEQKRLANSIFECKNKVIASNSNTAFIREIYKDVEMKTITVQRNISGNKSSRVQVEELIIIKEKTI